LVYGIMIDSISIIGTNIVVLFFSLTMLYLIFKNRGKVKSVDNEAHSERR
jgi:hypothetical protein